MGYVFRNEPMVDLPLRPPAGVGDHFGFRLWTWRKDPAPQPRRIVFFVWGFDPEGEKHLKNGNVQYFWNLINAHNLATSIVDLQSRELVLAMPLDTKISVETNGKGLIQVLDWFRGEVSAIDIVGFSMGGLIAKYALQSMAGRTEKIKTYFSYDTPHRGANVPLSVQYAVDYLQHKGGREQWNNINSDAAREALIYHFQPNWVDQAHPVCDQKRKNLLAKYAAMAQNKRLLAHIPARYAIANGDSTERFAGGTYLGGIRGLGVDCHFDALRSGQRFIYIWACGYRVWQAATVKAMPVDGMGGGTSDYMGTLLKRIHDAIKLPEISREMSKPICFVPNRSALDQKFDPDGPAHEEDSKIDFTDICVMSGSTEHVSVHDQTKRFILERLSN